MPTYSASFGGRAGRAKKGVKKSKGKCPICKKQGHSEKDCPKYDSSKSFKNSNSGGAVSGPGSGVTHKQTRKANKTGGNSQLKDPNKVELPKGFFSQADLLTEAGRQAEAQIPPFAFIDTG